MDNLLDQMRERFYGAEKDNKEEQQGSSSSRDRRLASHKSVSFKEKKATESWFRRQFSRKMSGSDNEMEHITAVAAAVFAVRSIEEPQIPSHPHKSPAKINKEEDETRIIAPPNPLPKRKVSRRLSEEDVLKETEDVDTKETVITEPHKPKPKQPAAPSPSLIKPQAYSDQRPDRSGRNKPEAAAPKPLPPPPPPTPHPSVQKPVSTGPDGARETEADAWEKAEMAKIKEKYKKVYDTISYWEDKKRDKARRKLELAQGVGVDPRKRERARRKYEEDLEFIRQIAGEARSKAAERRRNDILKAKHKADVLRKTGELPVTWFCC